MPMSNTATKETIQQAAIRMVKARDSKGLFKFLSKIKAPDQLPLMCDINQVGSELHGYAWDVLEDWQNNEVPTWTK